ncbi:hypothetical protein [Iodobacter ciconiae]|uniref:Uncharacterized protein n=1 Tax=Iodobacter ciconiae TaxID=2496266 RepID=A0A3S8ZT13_9NEIS|nr:hypothetical protein [Iodobacter ciconiae]AZN36561.1 hypothetical protein EJO50_08655 [Iodobacter ciconiae]
MNNKILVSLFLSTPVQQAYATKNQFYTEIKPGWVYVHNACESHYRQCKNNELGIGLLAG